ncbi:DinB family protein [Arthrobacter zhaoxinii]|uniref:DinB family protein n=1 Tax=Arthrobacter zhaoxinii TaxID=2964616 RepID=A0ABY5YP32_9MICC|nr:DinB family protein [Arthrobacter zhaoxinii]UWX96847.1 DinB family protein [Arthrobacter zhaoxinii]
MNQSDLLVDAFGRLPSAVRRAVNNLDAGTLNHRPYPDGNSVSWLIWHLSRVEDYQVAEVAGQEQVWTANGWAERVGLPLAVEDTGYGHTSEQVAQVQVESAELLVGYYGDVHSRTAAFVSGLSGEDLEQIVDRAWDPPVTLGVRLVSTLADCLEHVGQAAYVRGMVLAQAA